jgi:hypothetical protein
MTHVSLMTIQCDDCKDVCPGFDVEGAAREWVADHIIWVTPSNW